MALQITSRGRAVVGLTLLLVVQVAWAALSLIWVAVQWVGVSEVSKLPGSGLVFKGMEGLGIVASVVSVVGLVLLGRSVAPAALVWANIAAEVVGFGLVRWARTLIGLETFPQLQIVSLASVAVGLLGTVLFMMLLVQVGGGRKRWFLPLGIVLGLVGLVQTVAAVLASLFLHGRTGAAEQVMKLVAPGMSLAATAAHLVLLIGVWASVRSAPATAAVPAVEAGTSAAASRDFIFGGVLLAIGLVVTVVSFQTASGGGRYVVMTGAIASGLVMVVRGFIRLGSPAR